MLLITETKKLNNSKLYSQTRTGKETFNMICSIQYVAHKSF